MNDYSKFDFYSTTDKETNEGHYFLRVDKKMIEVSKDVYYVCYNSYRKQLRDNLRDQNVGLMSTDMLLQDGKTLLDYLGDKDNEIVGDQKTGKLENILNAINELNVVDKELIIELLLNDKKERDLAIKYKVSQQMINKKKKRIIKKIKEKIDKGC